METQWSIFAPSERGRDFYRRTNTHTATHIVHIFIYIFVCACVCKCLVYVSTENKEEARVSPLLGRLRGRECRALRTYVGITVRESRAHFIVSDVIGVLYAPGSPRLPLRTSLVMASAMFSQQTPELSRNCCALSHPSCFFSRKSTYPYVLNTYSRIYTHKCVYIHKCMCSYMCV